MAPPLSVEPGCAAGALEDDRPGKLVAARGWANPGGKTCGEQTAELAGQLAISGAEPLAHNGYKIPLMRNLVKRAIRETGALALARLGHA